MEDKYSGKDLSFANKCMLIAEIIIFVIGIIISVRLGVDRLSAIEIINISFDWATMLLLIIMFNSCMYGQMKRDIQSFVFLIFSVFCCVFFDFGCWIIDRIQEGIFYNYFFNIACNTMILVSAGLYYDFVCKSIGVSRKKISYFVISVILLGVIAEFLNIGMGYYYYVDSYGEYHRNNLGGFLGYIPFVLVFIVSGYLIIKNNIRIKEKLIFMSYIAIPVSISVFYMLTGFPPTFSVGTAISVFFIYSYIYIGREKDNAQKEIQIVIQKNKLMLSQIKPHFLYNCLGSIEELCKIDPEMATVAVNYFAKYLRGNMDSINKKELTTFSNELKNIRNYIWLEKMRFDDELEFEEEVEIETFFIPTLCVQPIVENAVKHGMMGKSEGVLHVLLKAFEEDENYKIIVEDDGCGFDPNEKKEDGRSHVGIMYVREIIEDRIKGKLEIDSVIDKGTKVTITIPKSTK